MRARRLRLTLSGLALAAMFIGGVAFAQSEAPNGGAPDASEPAHTAPREIALRQALDAKGYSSVHFELDGDTIILWGTAPTEADRLMIQTQVFLVARIFSIEDHIIRVPDSHNDSPADIISRLESENGSVAVWSEPNGLCCGWYYPDGSIDPHIQRGDRAETATEVNTLKSQVETLSAQKQAAEQKSDAGKEQVKSLQTQVQELTGDNQDLRLGVKLLPWWRATAVSVGVLALTMFGVTLLMLFECWRMRRRFVALAAMADALSRLDYEYKQHSC